MNSRVSCDQVVSVVPHSSHQTPTGPVTALDDGFYERWLKLGFELLDELHERDANEEAPVGVVGVVDERFP